MSRKIARSKTITLSAKKNSYASDIMLRKIARGKTLGC
jgi:hypothetical protein